MKFVILAILVLSTFTTGDCLYEFRCNFEYRLRPSEQFVLERRIDYLNGDDWGERARNNPMVFDEANDFNLFMNDLKIIQNDVMNQGPFNDMENLSLLMKSYNLSPKKGFKNFFKTYTTPLHRPRRDNFGLVREVFDRLGALKRWYSVKMHNYFAMTDVDISQNRIKEILETKDERYFYKEEIKRPQVIGIINFVIPGKNDKKEHGYIVLDMEYKVIAKVFEAPHMNDEASTTFFRFGSRIKYSLLKRERAAIEVLHTFPNKDGEFVFKSRDVIFVENPLCLLIQTTNKMIWNTPIRTIARSSTDGIPQGFIFAELAASTLTRFNGDTFCMGYIPEGEDKPVTKTFRSLKQLNRDDLSFLEQVCQRLKYTVDEAKAMIKEMAEFKKEYQSCFKRDSVETPILRWLAQFLVPKKTNCFNKTKTVLTSVLCL